MTSKRTTVLAGSTLNNATLFHRTRFLVPDSSAIIDFADGSSIYLVRDIEMGRARAAVRADLICCSADFPPENGLSPDRDTALAQATAECLRQANQSTVTVDRTLPYLFAHYLLKAGIKIEYSPDIGVTDRRAKDEEEIKHLRHAQKITGDAVSYACRTIANAIPDKEGILHHDGEELTSERMRKMITAFLVERNFSNAKDSIVATLPDVAMCHNFGSGPLKVDLPVIVDIFPMDNNTRYNGDMTRTVVNGTPSDELVKMHATVCKAKAAGCEALKAGTTGEAVHLATAAVIEANGYSMARGDSLPDMDVANMRHGTGHGIGLEVHEPILLDHGGGRILENEILTVEPGLYSAAFGGVRVEDMVRATADGHEILSPIHEGLNWKD